jgi:hypothetical protein
MTLHAMQDKAFCHPGYPGFELLRGGWPEGFHGRRLIQTQPALYDATPAGLDDKAGVMGHTACDRDDSHRVQGLKVRFVQVSSFRFLDEVDLSTYWISEGFPTGSHVLEV